ncbi:MAG: hypothetical protein Q9186_003129 [Xanthomendoza sp. 1 TL-2023]
MPNSGSKPKGSLLSPPSSPEMDQHHLNSVDGRWSNTQGRQPLPLRSARPELDQTFSEDRRWTEQADVSGSKITPAPRDHPRTSQPNPLFDSQFPRQAAWSTSLCNQEGTEPGLAAESEPNTYVTVQKHPIPPGELYQIRVPVGTSSPQPDASNGTEDEDEDLLSPASGEDEGQDLGELPSKTPAERRAEKRKMRRFRFVGLARK